jgi:hypothetical protein
LYGPFSHPHPLCHLSLRQADAVRKKPGQMMLGLW